MEGLGAGLGNGNSCWHVRASRDFYSFSGYEFCISTITLSLVKCHHRLLILLISEIHFQISEMNIVTSKNLIPDINKSYPENE